MEESPFTGHQGQFIQKLVQEIKELQKEIKELKSVKIISHRTGLTPPRDNSLLDGTFPE